MKKTINPILAKPIIFSVPMIKALLSGQKTMTRRIIGMSEYDFVRIVNEAEVIDEKTEDEKKIFGTIAEFQQDNEIGYYIKCPYGKIGDYLWVRESFAPIQKKSYIYKATETSLTQVKWKPPLFMPKAACRLWLKIVGIKVARIQSTTYQDILNEGWDAKTSQPFTDRTAGEDANDWWKYLWTKINGKESWEENDWVWVIEFEKCARPNWFC